MSILAVDRRAWRALFAEQLGLMLDAMDFLLFSFAVIPIREEFGLSNGTMGALTSVALIASAISGMPSDASPTASGACARCRFRSCSTPRPRRDRPRVQRYGS